MCDLFADLFFMGFFRTENGCTNQLNGANLGYEMIGGYTGIKWYFQVLVQTISPPDNTEKLYWGEGNSLSFLFISFEGYFPESFESILYNNKDEITIGHSPFYS